MLTCSKQKIIYFKCLKWFSAKSESILNEMVKNLIGRTWNGVFLICVFETFIMKLLKFLKTIFLIRT